MSQDPPLPDTAIRATERWLEDAWKEYQEKNEPIILKPADLACIGDLIKEIKRLRELLRSLRPGSLPLPTSMIQTPGHE